MLRMSVSLSRLIGDVIPQNVLEIVMCMFFMLINLTLFRYVTGEVSTIVMKSDEETVARRMQLESVETLLKDPKIGQDVGEEIRHHFRNSQITRAVDQAQIFRKLFFNFLVQILSFFMSI